METGCTRRSVLQAMLAAGAGLAAGPELSLPGPHRPGRPYRKEGAMDLPPRGIDGSSLVEWEGSGSGGDPPDPYGSPQEDGPDMEEGARMLVVSTWPFGLVANERTWERLLAGAEVLDAVVDGATVVELDPEVHTVGLGSFPNAQGAVQLDAAIMYGPTRACGAVAALERIATATAVARQVMERTPHILLAGEGALSFARQQGFTEVELLTEPMRLRWERWLGEQGSPPVSPPGHDTLGLIAIDSSGVMAGICTSSGLAFKLPGRVGDSPIIGAGLYLDQEVGGATATGVGEEIIRVCGSHLIVELMRQGWAPQAACEEACDRVISNHPGAATIPNAAFLAVRRDGEVGAACVNQGYFRYALSTVHEGHRLLSAPGRLAVAGGR